MTTNMEQRQIEPRDLYSNDSKRLNECWHPNPAEYAEIQISMRAFDEKLYNFLCQKEEMMRRVAAKDQDIATLVKDLENQKSIKGQLESEIKEYLISDSQNKGLENKIQSLEEQIEGFHEMIVLSHQDRLKRLCLSNILMKV